MWKRSVLPTALLATILAMWVSSASGGLLESMPAGSGFYLDFDPEAVGMDRFLESLAATSLGTDGDMEQLREILGFNPMSWGSWADSMAIDPDGEIGLIVEMGDFDPDLAGLYLPTSDPAALEGFFRRIFGPASGFIASLKFREAGDHMIVLLAEDPNEVAAFDPSGPAVGDDPHFAGMTGPDLRGTPMGSIYVDLSALGEGEDLSNVLFRAAADDDRVSMSLSARTVDTDLTRFASLLSSSAGEAQFSVPEGTDGTLRVSLDMDALLAMLTDEGITAEYDAGAAPLGLMPAADLLALLSGEMLLTIASTQTQYTAILQIGLDDPESMEALLLSMRTIIGGAEGNAITSFDMDGIPCYRIDFTVAPGMHTLEYGVIDDALVIAAGCSLRDPSDGRDYGDWIGDRAPDLDTRSAVIFSATSILLQDLIGNDTELSRSFSLLSGRLDLATASLDVDGDLLSLLVTLEPADGDPDSLVTRILTTFFLAVLFG